MIGDVDHHRHTVRIWESRIIVLSLLHYVPTSGYAAILNLIVVQLTASEFYCKASVVFKIVSVSQLERAVGLPRRSKKSTKGRVVA
jgi:hypothetical protein